MNKMLLYLLIILSRNVMADPEYNFNFYNYDTSGGTPAPMPITNENSAQNFPQGISNQVVPNNPAVELPSLIQTSIPSSDSWEKFEKGRVFFSAAVYSTNETAFDGSVSDHYYDELTISPKEKFSFGFALNFTPNFALLLAVGYNTPQVYEEYFTKSEEFGAKLGFELRGREHYFEYYGQLNAGFYHSDLQFHTDYADYFEGFGNLDFNYLLGQSVLGIDLRLGRFLLGPSITYEVHRFKNNSDENQMTTNIGAQFNLALAF